MTDVLIVVATAREQIADFLSALLLRLHPPDLRLHRHVADLLVRRARSRTRAGRARCSASCATSASPTCGIFRRFIPPIGPVDISPIVAILVLQIVGGIIVVADPRVSPRTVRARGARGAVVARACSSPTRSSRRSCASSLDARRGARRSSPASSSSTCATRASRSASCRTAGSIVVGRHRGRARRAARLLRAPRRRGRWIWLPTGLLLGGALGNIVDRIREGAVIDFIKLPHWPAFNVADIAITVGVIVLAARHGARRCELDVPPEAAGERLDAFLAAAARVALARAAADRRRARARRRRRRRASATACAAASASTVDEAPDATPRRRDGRTRRRRFAVAYEDEHLHRRRQAGGRRRAPGARAPRRARSRRRSPAASPAARRTGARASCTGWTATRPGCSSSPRATTCTAALKAALAAREMRREYLALVEGRPPARTGTIEAPIGRDRRVRTRMSTDTDAPQAGDHALRDRARAAAGDAAARAAADRAHAPDPRPPAGDRPPGLRRPASTARAGLYGLRAPVPARGAARVRASGDAAEPVDVELAAAATISPPRWRGSAEQRGLSAAGRPVQRPPRHPTSRIEPTGGRGREDSARRH